MEQHIENTWKGEGWYTWITEQHYGGDWYRSLYLGNDPDLNPSAAAHECGGSTPRYFRTEEELNR